MRWWSVGVLAASLCAACADGGTTPRDGGGGTDASDWDVPPPPPECSTGDSDEDGYGDDPTCPAPDCDDTNRAVHPGALEACNGRDEDCDDAIDEGLFTRTCGAGACMREIPNCIDGRPSVCPPDEPGAETCNRIDDDCDGAIDEGAGAETCGVGACMRTSDCTGGMAGMCTPGAPGTETCNAIDDDCDASTDEGFRATSINTTYTELATHHSPCNGSAQRIGPDCNAAIHRYCAARGCTTSGFGPVENSGDVSVVACVAGGATMTVSFATLATHHDGCNGTTERIGMTCNAAIHRFCRSMGFESGFGPVESGASDVTVTCVPMGAGETVMTTYTTLSGHHAACTATSRIGSDCNAAMHRFCAARGAVSGYGPVENSGDTAYVVCVRL